MTDQQRTPRIEEAAAAAVPCEHVWSSHCHNGVSARVCMLCHAPDLDAVKRLFDAARFMLGKHAKECYDPDDCYCTPLREALEHGI